MIGLIELDFVWLALVALHWMAGLVCIDWIVLQWIGLVGWIAFGWVGSDLFGWIALVGLDWFPLVGLVRTS